MNIYLKNLSLDDGKDIFYMLKRIGNNENSFTNPVHDMSFEQFKEWLIEAQQQSFGKNLPKGYVRQSIYWLMKDNTPVGIGKIRHELTEYSRRKGGNIGYAIDPIYRNLGYGKTILNQLIKKAKALNITEFILTVDKGNIYSKKIVEKNGGVLFDENTERWYFKF